MKTPIKEIIKRFPKGCCHRGFHGILHPENSIHAFEEAISMGMPFELDVHLSLDKKIIVSHDSSLERMTGINSIIEDMDSASIRELPLRDGTKIPLLEEVEEIRQEKVPLVLEIKTHEGNHKEIVEALRPILEKMDPSNVVIISFDAKALRLLKDTDFNLGLLIGEKKNLFNWKWRKEIPEFDFLDCGILFLRLFRSIQKYRKKGGIVFTWTVQSKKDLRDSKVLADVPTWERVRSNKPFEKQKEDEFYKEILEKGLD